MEREYNLTGQSIHQDTPNGEDTISEEDLRSTIQTEIANRGLLDSVDKQLKELIIESGNLNTSIEYQVNSNIDTWSTLTSDNWPITIINSK